MFLQNMLNKLNISKIVRPVLAALSANEWTLLQLVAYLVNTKNVKKAEKWLKPWQMGIIC